MDLNVNVKVKDVIRGKRALIDVHCNTTVNDTLEILAKEHLISVSVYGEPGHWLSSGGFDLTFQNKQYIGMVNLANILEFCLRSVRINEQLNRPISEAIGLTTGNESLSLWVELGSSELMTVMERFAKGVHHALVDDHEDVAAPIKILSSTDIVRYFYEHVFDYPSLEMIFRKLVSNISHNNIAMIKENDSMMEAITALQKVSALPVIDSSGDMVAVLSRSDLRDHFRILFDGRSNAMTVMEFLLYRHENKIPEPVFVTPTDTLRTAVILILTKKIHRVWVQREPTSTLAIRPDNHPCIIGVLTLSDIVQALYSHFKHNIEEEVVVDNSLLPVPIAKVSSTVKSEDQMMEVTEEAEIVTTKNVVG